MSNPTPRTPPPDQTQRERALNPANSVLVQAPAGSGKTDLLTRRFLRLLTEVEDPSQIVAITFTKAAAAEMRHRILSHLEEASAAADTATKGTRSSVKGTGFSVKGTGFSPYINPPNEEKGALAPEPSPDPFSMESLAARALHHSQTLGWNLLDQPAQLRISTIDSFCRDIALQQPLLSGLGDGLGIYDQPEDLYRRAARQALQQIDSADQPLRASIESLLLWRDNNWAEMETLLVQMLQNRDRWMHGFVLDREQDWDALRQTLERPFAQAIHQSLTQLSQHLDQVPGSRDETLALARFACQQGAAALFQPLAELPDFPAHPADFASPEEAQSAYLCLANLLLTLGGDFRKTADKRLGFPADRKREKAQLLDLIARLAAVPGLGSALAAVRSLPPARYTDDDWQIVRACFTLLRNAAAQLRVVFAEAGAVDYVEVAQIALSVLTAPDNQPSDAAIALADGIHHILVDEFQDTSRRQHELLRRLIAAWPEREGRSCFVVGDPMQSIYFFRDADAELFPRVREAGLEMPDAIPSSDPLLFDSVALTSNFRTAAPLVVRLNQIFTQVFAANDGSGVTFTPADPARNPSKAPHQPQTNHINFTPQINANKHDLPDTNGNKIEPVPPPFTAPSQSRNLNINFYSQVSETIDSYQTTIAKQTQPSPSSNQKAPNSPVFYMKNRQQIEDYNNVIEINNSTANSTAPAISPEITAPFVFHVNFQPQLNVNKSSYSSSASQTPPPSSSQVPGIVNLIRSHSDRVQQAKTAGEKYRIAVLGRTRNALAPIALALREAGIPFRAVDLEKLATRPEILDALALAQALLNPLNRVAWLGLLRAPWCGLSLADLHILTSADDPALLARPVPELLDERIPQLSPDGRLAAQRLLDALASVPALRFAHPSASLGAWLQQVWLRLGGALSVTPIERANLDLLWQQLDSLPNGEQDLLGPALQSTLQALTAQPDPAVSGDCGVQLMTIHKSKGLEFEVVIVPELQAGASHGKLKLLSWLERGLPTEDLASGNGPEIGIEPDGAPQITEFLVAPLQSKGAERNSTKLWVDRVYRQRESQEMRRLFYVAATRARNQLHLFAQPACRQDSSGAWTLADPKESLLKTAWPALEDEIRARFEEWQAAQPTAESASTAQPVTLDLAASADTNLAVMPAPLQPTRLRRLPPSYRMGAPGLVSETRETTSPHISPAPPISRPERAQRVERPASTNQDCHPERAQRVEGPASWSPEFSTTSRVPGPESPAPSSLYRRHEGGLHSRALGTAVHTLLEHAARLRKTQDWDAARASLEDLHPAIAANIRAAGLAPAQAESLADEALRLAIAASNDPTGAWILSPHPEDAAEVRWTGLVSGQLRTVQVDRLFRAGLQPLTEGQESWWIVDYKTAHADIPNPAAALPELRAQFAPQLETYAAILRKLHGPNAQIRAGLYYPRMSLFDWWEIPEA